MPQPLRFQAATTEDRDFPMTVSRTAGPKRVRRLAGTAAKPQASETISPARAREPGIAHVVATSLEEDIVLGRRHPRERLIEQDLCEHFNTHRGDVRLALFELEKKGLIQRIPNRGAMVRDLTPKEVTEIYAVREELEVMAARILPLPVDASDLTKLDELQSKHSAAVDAGDMLTVSLLRQRLPGSARQCTPRPRRNGQSIARRAPRRPDCADAASPETLPRSLHPRL